MQVGVITFYAAQAALLRAQLHNERENFADVQVATVDSFQGKEKVLVCDTLSGVCLRFCVYRYPYFCKVLRMSECRLVHARMNL